MGAMARQIEYDPFALKQNVLSVFWERGYAETSLSDLEAATGLNRRQLYNGIGDKRAMFLQALDDFSDVAAHQFLSPLETEDSGLAEIAALLNGFVHLIREEDERKGCMVCTSSQEEIAADGDVKKRIDAYFERIRAAYQTALTNAAERGELALSEEQIADRAEALLGIHVAVCVLGRGGRSPDKLERMVRRALDDIQ